MLKHKVLRKVLAVSLVATMLAGTGFTAAGQYVGTDISVNATEELVASKYGIIGNFTEWGNLPDVPMYETEKGVYIGKTNILPAGDYAFEVRADSSWTEMYSVYEYSYDRTLNSQTSVKVTLAGNASIAVMLDTRGKNSEIWPLSYAVVENDSDEYDWIYLGKGTPTWELDPTINDFDYQKRNPSAPYYSGTYTVTITGYTGSGGDIKIPDKIEGYAVTEIRSGAFKDCTNITSATFPDSVTSIGSFAFDGCAGLTSINIPDSVTYIGGAAFDGCAGLTSINIPDGVEYIYESTFRDCTGLTSVTLPDSVLSIEKEAFSGCTNLADITIGSGLQQISYVAFENCTGIENITVSENNTAFASYDGALLNKRKTAFQLFPKAKKGTYTVPDSMGAIDGYTFTGSSVDKVILPESVTYISDYAFSSSSLKSIMIPDSVEYIGAFAFSDCNNLLSVTIGNGVTEIDETAFRNSPNLTIYGEKDSYAETYANENKIPFSSEILNNKIVLGETVTINAAMISSNGNYTYAVLYKKKADTKWTVKQDYSTNDIITVKPAKATDYDICVKVKDSEGKIVKNFFEAKVNTKLANTSTISATDINKGDTVTVNGFATGGMGEYTYAVLYKKKAETKWTVRQDYSANNEILVRPYTSTDYDICIKVKDKDGTIVKKFFTVIVKDNKLQNTSTISATEIKKGDSVTLKGTATGGAGEYTYAVLYKKKAETKWTVRQGYKTNDEILVRPYTNTDYDICVKVKDKDGTIVKKYFTLTVK